MNELTPEEELERNYLLALQSNPNRWFSGFEFARLRMLNEKKFNLSEE